MDVYEAVTSRRAVRGFKDEPVSREMLERVLSAAAWSPSGSNIQPWNTYVLTGAPLAELKTCAVERVAHGDRWDERQYEMYPPKMKSPYGERRSAFGKERYSALGIAREDWEARQRAAIANWNCFGAPAALFCYIDPDLGRPQWADVGMYLQTVMLLLRAEGCTVARRWRGRRFARRSRRSFRPRTGSSSSAACRRVRGPHGKFHPYRPRPAPRDGHVRRRLVTCPQRTRDPFHDSCQNESDSPGK
jgi:nitroreductase